MRKYLAQLHKKPDHHKRQFALLASGTITLLIFGIWSLVTFGEGRKVVVVSESGNEVSPFHSLGTSVAATLEALKGSFVELKTGLETINLEAQYKDMKKGALDIYGQ